MKSFTILYCRW